MMHPLHGPLPPHRPDPGPGGEWHRPDPLSTLWLTVYGQDGTNGLRGLTKQHAADIAVLKAWQTRLDGALTTSLALARWSWPALLVFVVMASSDDQVAFLARKAAAIGDIMKSLAGAK